MSTDWTTGWKVAFANPGMRFPFLEVPREDEVYRDRKTAVARAIYQNEKVHPRRNAKVRLGRKFNLNEMYKKVEDDKETYWVSKKPGPVAPYSVERCKMYPTGTRHGGDVWYPPNEKEDE